MKYLLILSLLIAISAQAQTITPKQAKDSVGKTETVCGAVFNVHVGPNKTYINFGDAYPNQVFSVAIDNDDASKFSYKLETLENKKVCITGLLKMYKEKPEIIVTDEKQIEIK
jgi:hypothetical protein